MLVKASGIVECLSEAADSADGMNSHHHRVACIAAAIGEAYGLSKNKSENLISAAALHDIGGLGLNAGLDLIHFDSLDEGSDCHCRRGALLVKKFRPFAHLAPIIRHHHAFWNQRHDGDVTNVPVESRILFLADRVAVLMTNQFRLDGVYDTREKVYGRRGSLFMPEAVDAFIEVSRRESFWFDARDAVIQPLLEDTLSRNLYLDCEDLLGLGKLFSQAVDFRNSFMASHSSGVASVADTLAELCGFSRDELVAIRLAGLLHDIGKLAISEAVLEKSGQLTAEESEKMKSHAYYTNRLLLKIREFDTIRSWASLHH
jgi:response regulator RpfG family c-di-GMP phosphodiesterase